MSDILAPELRAYVDEQIRAGRFQTLGEAIDEALRLLREHDRVESQRLEALRREIAEGDADFDRGDWVDGPTFFAELRRLGEERRAARP